MCVWIHSSLLLLLSVFISVQSISIPDSHRLYSALHNFDTLTKITDVRQRVARDTLPRPLIDEPKLVQFDTLGRNFKLFLRPHSKPFHPRSHVQYSGNVRTRINVSQYYTGYVIGAESSHVIAHLTDDGVLTAVIMADDESYYIEPSGRHFGESHDFHMISYRGSDLKFNMTGEPLGDFCGTGTQKGSKVNDISSQTGSYNKHDGETPLSSPDHDGSRLKRQANEPPEADTVCPVSLVATTSFYRHFGAENVDHTVNFLLVILLQIDAIFRKTDWVIPGVSGSASPGVRGLQIANVIVHDSTDNSPDYNSESGWASDAILREFATVDWSDYCLAHLFTGSTFTDGRRLGVAYTAFADSLRAGGICSRRTTYQNEPFSGNVGASSYRGDERFLVLAEAIIVTAHEFGHSWGSGHDPDTSQCSPPFDGGGKFLMYAFAQDGQSTNNKIFSSCSRQAISLVLNTHESECFIAPSVDQCGNFIVDDGEDCDPGPSRMLQGGDDCCNEECQFKTNSTSGLKYTCSDTNHDCCFECAISPVGVVCREEESGNQNCLSNATCNGIDVTCPSDPVFVDQGTSCGVMGQCSATGSCIQFCELQNLTTCFCTGDMECSLCCKDAINNGSCMPFDSSTFLPKGRFCEGGTCDGLGVCVESDPDLSTYLFDLLTEFNTAAFVQFLEENIVGVVIFLSLLVWIPVSVAVHIFDVYLEKKNEKKKKQKKSEAEERRKKRRLLARGAVRNEPDMITPLLGGQRDSSPQHSPTPPRHIAPPTASSRVHPAPVTTTSSQHSIGTTSFTSYPIGPPTTTSPSHTLV